MSEAMSEADHEAAERREWGKRGKIQEVDGVKPSMASVVGSRAKGPP